MMIITGVHWAAMPPSRVETIDVKTLHIKGEFVESNLGTTMGTDGKATVRLIAQQYSFEPQCIVVPAEIPVTFRATKQRTPSMGFVIGTTNANTMLIPRLRGDVHHDVQENGRAVDAVSRILWYRPRGHVGRACRFSHPRNSSRRRAAEKGLDCVPR
jgi:hypothetical protein